MTARHLLLTAAFLLALPMGSSCSSSSNDGKKDAAQDVAAGADVADTGNRTDIGGAVDRGGGSDGGADGDEDCEKNGCPKDLECMPCEGDEGSLIFMCLPPDEAC